MEKLFSLLFALLWLTSIGAQSTDPCFNGGFESDFESYDGHSGSFNTLTDDQSCQFNGTVFSNLPNPSTETDFFIETGGTDPFITDRPLDRVRFEEQSARINDSYVQYNIDQLSKTFVVPDFTPASSYRWYYHYALVMENPAGHNGIQPFFQVKLCSGDDCAEVLCLDADLANNPVPDNLGMDIQRTANTPIVFKDWTCDFIEFGPEDIGETFTVEFIASDCGAGAHWGYAYVDGICEPCGPSGEVVLDPIPEPCDQALPLTVSGTLSLPEADGITGSITADNIRLYIAHQDGNVTIVENPSLDFPDFSFSLDASVLTEVGCYDFRAEVVYEFDGAFLNPIYSMTANPNTTLSNGVYNDYCNNTTAPCDCIDPGLSLNKRELSTCIPGSLTNLGQGGTFTLPIDPTTGMAGTVEEIVVNVYHATSSNTPFSSDDLVLGGLPAQVQTATNSFSFLIDLSLLGPGCYHLEVLGSFECNGDPIDASYVDFYNFCYETDDCTDPGLVIEPFDGSCVPIGEEDFQLCGSYVAPMVLDYEGQLTDLFVRISGGTPFQNYDIPITDIDPVNKTFCITLTGADFPEDLNLTCMNVVFYATFDLVESQVTATAGFYGEDGICFSNCCEFSVEGKPFCSMSTCDDYAEYAHITVRKGSDCGPGGYVKVTILTDGEFYGLATGGISTMGTTHMNNYNGLHYYGSFFRPINDFNGAETNCYLVEVFSEDDLLLHSEEICFDEECKGGTDGGEFRTLTMERVNCHPTIPEGPAPDRLTFRATDRPGEVMVSYPKTDGDRDVVCTYVNIKTYQDNRCCDYRGEGEARPDASVLLTG